jgi:pilus assembly protein Flp/PilA
MRLKKSGLSPLRTTTWPVVSPIALELSSPDDTIDPLRLNASTLARRRCPVRSCQGKRGRVPLHRADVILLRCNLPAATMLATRRPSDDKCPEMTAQCPRAGPFLYMPQPYCRHSQLGTVAVGMSIAATFCNRIQLAFRFLGHSRPMTTIRRFLGDESGATAIEYALIAMGIAFVIIAAVDGIGSKLNTKFTSISTGLK